MSGPQAPRAVGADQALVDEVVAWFQARYPEIAPKQDEDRPIVLVGAPPPAEVRLVEPANPPAGAVLRVKRGKLSWVDLFDPKLREPLNALIRDLDRQQKWSFNGVVSTRYQE